MGYQIPDALVVGLADLVAKKKSAPVPKPPNFFDLSEDAYTLPRDHKVPIGSWLCATIHQTGSPIGVASWPRQRRFDRWARHVYTDPKTGKAIKTSLKAHIGITRNTKDHPAEVLLVHPLEWFIWHAQRQSLTHIGFEIECFARGLEGDPDTLPSGGFPWLEATDEQMAAAISAVQWVDAVVRFYNGVGLKYINGHGNADDGRRADPGSRIYKGVVLPCIELLGLSDQGKTYKTGDGRKTPEAWNPAYVGNPY